MSPEGQVTAICGRLLDALSHSASKYDSYFAGLVRSLQLAAESDIHNAAPIYQSLDWWGGSGSFADGAGCELPLDKRKIVLQLIADLRDVFHGAGIDFPRADDWSSTFRGWLRDGIFDEESS